MCKFIPGNGILVELSLREHQYVVFSLRLYISPGLYLGLRLEPAGHRFGSDGLPKQLSEALKW